MVRKISFIFIILISFFLFSCVTTEEAKDIGKQAFIKTISENISKENNFSKYTLIGLVLSFLSNVLLLWKTKLETKKKNTIILGIEKYKENNNPEDLLQCLKQVQEKYNVRESIMKDIKKLNNKNTID